MFQIAIKNFIKSLKSFTNALETAYNETYVDMDLAREAMFAINNMRKKNKDKFVDEMAILLTQKTLKMEGWLMPPHMAKQKGEEMFNDAMKGGDIDTYTYRLIEKKEKE